MAGAIFAAFGWAQTLPLPPGLLGRLSPKALELRTAYDPGDVARVAEAPAAEAAPGSVSAGWKPLSLHPWATRQSTLRFTAFLLVALMVLDLSARASSLKAIAGTLVLGGAFQALYGLFEYLSGRQHIFGYAKEHYTDVATGTFINRNHYAGYLAMTIPMAIAAAAAIFTRRRRERHGGVGERIAASAGPEMFLAALLLLFALTMATALASSRSRMGIASALLALLGAGAFLLWRGRARAFAVAGIVLVGATLVLFSQGAGSAITDRFLTLAAELQGGMGRWSIWRQAASVFLAFPLTGAGLGVFDDVFPIFRTTGPGTALAHAHNDFLEVAAETGLLGCVILALGSLAVARSMRHEGSTRQDLSHFGPAAMVGVLAIALHSLTDFNLAIPACALTFAVLFGVLAAWRRVPSPVLVVPAGSRPIPRRRLAGAAIACLVLAGGALWAAGAGALGWLPHRLASPLLRIADHDDAERLHRASVEATRPALEDLQILADQAGRGEVPSRDSVAYVEKRLREAALLEERALHGLPVSWRGHFQAGQIRASLCWAASLSDGLDRDCAAIASAELRAAVRLNPMGAATHSQVAKFYVSLWPALSDEMRREARPLIERAVEMNPGDDRMRAQWEGMVKEMGAGS